MPIQLLTRRTAGAVASAVLVFGGCTADTPAPAEDQTAAAGRTASPAATPSPTPTPALATSPSPTLPGPAAEPDGCPPAHEERADAPPAADAVPTTDTRTITEAPRGRPINVTLVTISTNGPVGEQITATLEQHVGRLIDQWDETAGPPPGEGEESEETGPPPPELEVMLTPGRVDETVVSVVLEGFEYLGGASGNGLIDGWVFSTVTGRELELADVGLDGACLDELGTMAADALAAEDVGMFEEAETRLREGESPMDRWSLHGGQLHVHFPAYELAPGAAGPLTARLELDAVHAATGTPLGGDG